MGYNTIPFNPFPPSTEQKGNNFELPIANADSLGGVKVGSGLSINPETGVLSNDNAIPYELPEATPETLGGIMVGDGLKATVGVLDVNVAQNGNLSFNHDGELMADNWTPPAFTTNESESGFHFGDKKIYQKILVFESGLILYPDTWTSVGITENIENFILCIGIRSDSAAIPLCAYNDSNDGIEFLSMRSTPYTADKIIIFYTKVTT